MGAMGRCVEARRAPDLARLCLLLVVSILTIASLGPASTAGAAEFTDEGHVFKDDFADLDSAYWATETAGGVLVGPALGRLEVVVPSDVTGARFFGIVAPWAGFYVKPDSYFRCSVEYECLQWPMPGNGVSVSLMVWVYDKKSKEEIYFLAISRESMPLMQGETFRSTIVDATGKKDKRYDRSLYMSQAKGTLSIWRDRHGFTVKGGPVLEKLKPKVDVLGKVNWALMVDGLDYNFKLQQVRVGFDDFRIRSEKGFHRPGQ
jgi:hypothetical protein